MKRKIIIILSSILSSSSSVASLFPARSLESTYLAAKDNQKQLLSYDRKTTIKSSINYTKNNAPTNKFRRFVGSLVYKGLKGLLHRVDESLIACEAALGHVVHLVLEV